MQELAEADHQDAVAHDEARPPQELNINPKEFTLALWDEAHMYLTPNAQSLVSKFDHAVNVGLTATPRYYEGKEVANVFGKKILEIDLDTAKKRGEVCDFENILVDTGIRTGIELTSTQQEEGPQVSSAINRKDRNLIFADLYKNAQVTVTRDQKEKKYTLAGEPTIVFGASIDHVHDMANAINAVLTPALKNDTVFRERLLAKGIDPDDPELVIAAPIHTGATEKHAGMSLDQRNELVDRYHRHKVLMMCATSVLQQSFDSPMTSVIMDSVPRQTYVGVGQAGMRATRSGKEMAIIINTQDADRPSLIFEDFRNNRGREEGVIVEIAKRHGNEQRKHAKAKIQSEDMPVASYNLTYGRALSHLAAQRRTQTDPLHRDDFLESSRHFTSDGYKKLNQLIVKIRNDDTAAVTEFIEVLQPWINNIRKRIEGRLFGEARAEESQVDEEGINDAATDALMDTIELLKTGVIKTWSSFSVRYISLLRDGLEKVVAGEDCNVLSYGKRVSWERTLRIPEPKEDGPTNDPFFTGALDRALEKLDKREREAVKKVVDERTTQELAYIFNLSRTRMGQIEDNALSRLRRPLRDWRPGTPLRDRERKVLRDQQRKVLEPMADAFISQKRIIFDMLKCNAGYVPTISIEVATQLPPQHIRALTDINSTEINDTFLEALSDESLAKMKANLPRYEGLTAEKMKAFDGATQELKNLLRRFKDAGGEPLPREHSATMGRY